MRMQGRARDLLTARDVSCPQVLAEDCVEIWASNRREITAIKMDRGNDVAQALVGQRGGGHLRKTIATLFAEELDRGTPLHLLLDDYPGASLVANWAWSRWMADSFERRKEKGVIAAGRNGRMEGVCSGFRPGSSALHNDGSVNPHVQSSARVPPLPHPDDPDGWHHLPEQQGVGMRRARRMDIWFDDRLRMDIGFQDSATSPDGGRVAVHEYRVLASADPDTLELLSIEAVPHVLPYRECPAAVSNTDRLIGLPLTRFRAEVAVELVGILGCTHLNDVLRSMSDVPTLFRRLRDRERPAPSR